MKETEKRRDGWRDRYGVEQTEIDALATLQPDVLREIVKEAIAPFRDKTLWGRVHAEEKRLETEANRRLDEALTDSDEPLIRKIVEEKLKEAQEAVEYYSSEVSAIAHKICREMPPVEVPAAIIGEMPDPLVSSDMELIGHIRTLRARKDYSSQAAEALQ